MNEHSYQVVAEARTQVPAAPVVYFVADSKAQLKTDADSWLKLSSASNWAVAAMVWAWVAPGEGMGARTDLTLCRTEQGSKMSANDFSKLEARGLRSVNTILKYQAVYQYAIDHGYARPSKVGQPIGLPGKDWDAVVKSWQESKEHPERPEPAMPWAFQPDKEHLTALDVNVVRARIEAYNSEIAHMNAWINAQLGEHSE